MCEGMLRLYAEIREGLLVGDIGLRSQGRERELSEILIGVF